MKSRRQPGSPQRRINEDPNVPEVSFGSWLRRHRELREVALSEIAAVTKISTRYLEALEEDRFDVLPAPVFAKGFLREYAKYVGLDPDDVVNSYITAQQQAAPEDDGEEEYGPRRSRLKESPLILLVVVVLLLGGGVTGLLLYGTRGEKEPESLPLQQVVPASIPPADIVAESTLIVPSVAEFASPLHVTLDFAENCWVEATVDGRRRISELKIHGDSLQLEAEQRVLLTLGNPTGVQIEVNGLAYSPEIVAGRVARDLDIDLALLEELQGSP